MQTAANPVGNGGCEWLNQRPELSGTAVAVLVLLPAATRTGVVATDLLFAIANWFDHAGGLAGLSPDFLDVGLLRGRGLLGDHGSCRFMDGSCLVPDIAEEAGIAFTFQAEDR